MDHLSQIVALLREDLPVNALRTTADTNLELFPAGLHLAPYTWLQPCRQIKREDTKSLASLAEALQNNVGCLIFNSQLAQSGYLPRAAQAQSDDLT
jgi:hypothetical protein